jgi:hypothetical protein
MSIGNMGFLNGFYNNRLHSNSSNNNSIHNRYAAANTEEATEEADAESASTSTASPYQDMLDKMKDSMNQTLVNSALSGYGDNNLVSNMDGVNLSPGVNSSYMMAKAQFEINYQSIQSISGANGTQLKEVNFSLSASFEFTMQSGGSSPIDPSSMDSSSMIEKMQEIFSPENTADRILNFALSWYSPEEGDTEVARQDFADTIGAAIQKGFDEALNILGDLEDEIMDGIDKTHELVFNGLDDFVKNGISNEQEEAANSISQYVEQWQASISYSYSSYSSSTTYSRPTTQVESTAEETPAIETEATVADAEVEDATTAEEVTEANV